MPLPPSWEHKLRTHHANVRERAGNLPSYDDSIFEGGDWPRSWHLFIGQDRAVEHLQLAIRSAKNRGVRLDHVLLASGVPGIGKSSLARLIAAEMGTGFVQVSGPIKMEEARPVLRTMKDGDIFFIEEAHTLGKADWLLTLLQDGVLSSAKGTETMPDVTVVAATTEAQTLTQALLSRFYIQPSLENYTSHEAAQIVHQLTERMQMKPLGDELAAAVARAAVNNPRKMRPVLGNLRDTYEGNGHYDFELTLRLLNLTSDGLDSAAQEYMLALFVEFSGCASEKNIAAFLNEPITRHTEALLIQQGYIEVKPTGRQLTEAGKARATELLEAIRER